MKYGFLVAGAALLAITASVPPYSADAQTSVFRLTQLAPAATEQFHKASKDDRVWSVQNRAALMRALEGLKHHGLVPEHYHLTRLKTAQSWDAATDRLATDAWFSAAAHMLYGKLDATSVEPDWTAAKRQADLGAILKDALLASSVEESLSKLAPKQPEYAALKAELARLKAENAKPQTVVPPGVVLKDGMAAPRVGLLKIRLTELGFLEGAETGDLFDAQLKDAVIAFQETEGLDADGVVGPATLRVLNRNLSAQIDQVRVNLERWRWLPDDLGRRHLRANIAGFDVTAWNDGVMERTHLTIVGRTYRKTPVFSDSVKYVVLNPWWETPRSLTVRDKLPTFRKDPSAVDRLGFQIVSREGSVIPSSSIDWANATAANFPHRIRQSPGPLNALGQVKIMFPNKHNVYLHDTPTRGLFAQRQRAFSSGCLRTENPLELTTWLLSETDDWDQARVDQVVADGREQRVNLKTPVPVHILYKTVVAEAGGTVRYLDDIYDRDGRVLAGLNATPNTR